LGDQEHPPHAISPLVCAHDVHGPQELVHLRINHEVNNGMRWFKCMILYEIKLYDRIPCTEIGSPKNQRIHIPPSTEGFHAQGCLHVSLADEKTKRGGTLLED